MPTLAVIQAVSRWLPQTETWLDTQVRCLPDDIESHVVCEATLNLDQFPWPHVHSLGGRPLPVRVWDKGLRRLGVRRHLAHFVRVARRTHARLVHSHFGNVGWQHARIARRLGLRHVVTFYGLDVSFLPRVDPRWHARYREMFADVDVVLCEGEFMAGRIVDLGCPREKVRVHHLGIPVERIAYAPSAWRPGRTLRVLMAGSFREKKGFPYAVEAVGRLARDVDVELTIVGDAHGDDRTLREKRRILEAIDRAGLRERTRLAGYQSWARVHEEARRHHVFLSPSVTAHDGDTEGGAPVSIIEMAALGLVVVSTTHCDIPGVIRHGESGLLAPERDVDALEAHLRWLVENPGRWRALQDAARAHVEAEFDAAVQGRRLGAIYRDLCGEPTA